MFRNAGHALSLVAAIGAVLAFLLLAGDGEAPLGRHLILVSSDASEIPAVRDYVALMDDEGFSVSSDSSAVFERLYAEKEEVTIFAVTRQSIETLSIEVWADLYYRGVVLIGLDVAVRELAPLRYGIDTFPDTSPPEIVQTPDGPAIMGMLPYTPERPIFSMISNNCSGDRRTSDWLGNFPIARLALERSTERCDAALES